MTRVIRIFAFAALLVATAQAALPKHQTTKPLSMGSGNPVPLCDPTTTPNCKIVW